MADTDVKEVLATQVKELQNTIVGKMDAYNDRLSETGGKVDTIAKSIESEIENRKKELEGVTERLDRIETSAQRLSEGSQKAKSFEQELHEMMKDNDMVEAYKAKKTGSVVLTTKAPITMTQAASLTGDVIAADRKPGVVFDPDRSQHIRQVVSTTTTSSNRISYTREDFDEDGAKMTGEGAEKGESSFLLVQAEAPVKKITSYFKMSREMLDDIGYLASHISLRAPQKLMLIEDNQLLYGTGLTVFLEGIAEVASPFAATSIGVIPAARNRFDVLAWAIQGVAQDEYRATAAYVNTADYWNMLLTKDAEGRYLIPNLYSGAQIMVGGVPVLWSTAVTADDFFVGDWSLGCEIADRQGTEVRFYDQDQDDAIKNLFTAVVEKSLAFPIYRPKAFVHDDFTTALAAT